VRPHCNDFLRELSAVAEIIIFTASSASYADVVLDYLDPHKKYFSHRLYRQHCTLEKNYYTKDLRCINRRLEDSVLVDNSGFSIMLQPDNGIPILPYYHFNKDRELLMLLDFLKELIKTDDVRHKLRSHFFLNKYFDQEGDPKKIFLENYGRDEK
jgi:CTD small phosphatase-like protein 2